MSDPAESVAGEFDQGVEAILASIRSEFNDQGHHVGTQAEAQQLLLRGFRSNPRRLLQELAQTFGINLQFDVDALPNHTDDELRKLLMAVYKAIQNSVTILYPDFGSEASEPTFISRVVEELLLRKL